jgi:hypothetical protein
MNNFLIELQKEADKFYKILESAKSYAPNNTIIIFDLDNTLFFSSLLPSEQRHSCLRPAVDPIVNLYYKLINLNYNIVLLSGKHSNQYNLIKENLDIMNITKYTFLILRSPSENDLSHGYYKARWRQALAREYFILASIANNDDDFVDGNTGLKFEIPNPPNYVRKSMR